MWKLVYGSVKGTSHARTGQPCQDYCAGGVNGTTVVAACADGAGSAELSHLGSLLAVERFMEEAKQSTLASPPTRETLGSWVKASRERLIEEAEAQRVTPRQLACTFLAVLVSNDWVAFVQVGDGVIVFDGEAGYELAFWPDNGEYANTTRFLTDDDYHRHLRIEVLTRSISDLAVLTDGLQMLALDFGKARVHDQFFAPLFRTVRQGANEAALRDSLLKFLDSKRVNDRTDDDKTLLLATRSAPDVSDCIPDAST